jgi:penicillin-binding protein 1C
VRRAASLILPILTLGAAGLLWSAIRIPEPAVPTFQAIRAAFRPSDVQLLDRNGEVIHEVRTDPRRRRLGWVGLSDISPALQAAAITSEDRRFYSHGGVDVRALAAAALQQLTGGHRRGASTISMQVATLLHEHLRGNGRLSPLTQKWRQIRLARAIERRWTKAEILEAYLNLATFRGELQGIGAAAAVLFGKAPHGITEAEATVLAVLLRAPNAAQETVTRRAWRLRGAQAGRMSREDILAAVRRAFDAPSGIGPRVALAPHAARHVLGSIQASPTAAGPIRSTLDGTLQRFAAEALRRTLLAARERNVHDGAVLVVDNRDGDVLAYVGGSGDLSSAPHVDGIRARRQAGSSLKPFLYGLALEERLLTPASLVEDVPTDLSVAGGLYRPKNYDEQFKGLLSLRSALAGSVNVPAVRTLELVGVETFVERLRRLGFQGLTESGDYYGPSLALGSADVSLWELVNAYRTLAAGGIWSPLRMTPDEGRAIPGRRLYSEQVAFLISNILADREGRSVTFGLENPLSTPFWSAVKTGTSKEMRDNWCVGYSRRYTVGVWVGNFSGEPMRDVSGVTGAAPVWLEVMAWLHRGTPSSPPPPPHGVTAQAVIFPRQIEPDRVEWFLEGTQPQRAAQVLAAGHPRIIAPAPGTMIALDPDIPPSRQRVLFEAEADGSTTRWWLDGRDLGPASDLAVWKPEPGKHRLTLVDDGGNTLDGITFEVRGTASTSGD